MKTSIQRPKRAKLSPKPLKERKKGKWEAPYNTVNPGKKKGKNPDVTKKRVKRQTWSKMAFRTI